MFPPRTPLKHVLLPLLNHKCMKASNHHLANKWATISWADFAWTVPCTSLISDDAKISLILRAIYGTGPTCGARLPGNPAAAVTMAITNTISYDLLLLIAGGGRLIAIADSLMSPPCTSLQGVVEHVPYKLLGTVMDYGLGMMPVILSLIPPLQTVGGWVANTARLHTDGMWRHVVACGGTDSLAEL